MKDQWTASDKGFDWCAKIFRETGGNKPHLVFFVSVEQSLDINSRLVSVGDALNSPRIAIILSRKEVVLFQLTLLRDHTSILSVSAKSMLRMPHHLILKTDSVYLKSLQVYAWWISKLQREGGGTNSRVDRRVG